MTFFAAGILRNDCAEVLALDDTLTLKSLDD